MPISSSIYQALPTRDPEKTVVQDPDLGEVPGFLQLRSSIQNAVVWPGLTGPVHPTERVAAGVYMVNQAAVAPAVLA